MVNIEVGFGKARITGYMDAITGKCQFLMKGQMKTYNNVLQAWQHWLEIN